MSDQSSNCTDNELIATNTFHEWWIAELRSSIAPTARDVEEDKPAAEPDAEPLPRRAQPRGKLLFACATGLFWGAAMIVLLDGGPEAGAATAQAATSAPELRGIVEVGEIRVLNPPGEPQQPAPFDRQVAANALGEAATAAAACAPKQRGKARVKILFDTSGSVKRADVVKGAFANTPVADCITKHMRAIEVPPFSGKDVVVYKTIRLR